MKLDWHRGDPPPRVLMGHPNFIRASELLFEWFRALSFESAHGRRLTDDDELPARILDELKQVDPLADVEFKRKRHK